MNRKLFGLCFIIGAAFTGTLLGGCHNTTDDAAAQKKAIEGRPMTAQEQKVMEAERAGAAQAAQQGAAQQAAAQHGQPK